MNYEVWIHNSNGFGFAYHSYKTKRQAELGLEKYKNLVEYRGCTFVLRRREHGSCS